MTDPLNMGDFYPDRAPKKPTPQAPQPNFQQRELTDIERIKPLLLKGKNQTEIARILDLPRETINRKIAKWSQTEDYRVFITSAWLEEYSHLRDMEDNRVEAFKQLTRYLIAIQTKKLEVQADVKSTETINAKVESEVEILVDYDSLFRERTAGTTSKKTL